MTKPKSQLLAKSSALVLLTLSLGACVDSSVFTGMNNSGTMSPGTNNISVTPTISAATLTEADRQLLTQIQDPNITTSQLQGLLPSVTNPFVKNALVLKLADNLTNENKYDAAKVYLQQYRQSADAGQQSEYNLVATKLGLATNDKALLATTTKLNPDTVSINQKLEATQLALIQSFRDGNIDDGLNQVDAVYPSLPTNDQLVLVNSTLKQLASLSPNKLQALATNAVNNNQIGNAGWYSLAQIVVFDRGNVQALNNDWKQWLDKYTTYNLPASVTFPSLFTQTATAAGTNIGNIAVLLPFTKYKNYSEAIKSGFDQANADSGNKATVSYYDTTVSGIQAAINDAYQSNSNLIVGPLLKENVEALANVNLSIPELMLNRVTAENPNACYIGLVIEDEAISAAKMFKAKGIVNPVIFTDGSASSNRAANTFASTWLKLKQQNVKVYQISDPATLHNQVQTMLKSTPSVDGVFFLGDTNALTTFQQEVFYINPSSNLLTMATSRSNSPTLSRAKLNDFKNVYFTDSDLIGNQNSNITNRAINAIGNADYNLRRMYGFGYDAFKIGQQYQAFRTVNNFSINGLNGEISRQPGQGCTLIDTMNIYRVVNGQLIRAN